MRVNGITKMLVLSRKVGESIVIGDNIKITVVKINGNNVRLGIEAPKEIPVVREELSKKQQNNAKTTSYEIDLEIEGDGDIEIDLGDQPSQ